MGGSSLNFLHFEDMPAREHLGRSLPFLDMLYFFQSNPLKLAAVSLSVLIIFVGGLLLTNWCRITLALLTKDILDTKRLNLLENLKSSRRPLWAVIKVSALTSMLMLLVAGALFGAPLWSPLDSGAKTLLWTTAAIVFIPLAYTISCINIFTVFFIVIFRMKFKAAINLGTDFFITNWVKILGLGLVLSVIFLAGSAVGGSAVFLGRLAESLALEYAGDFKFFADSAIILAVRIVSFAVLWLILAIINVFFNTSLLLLFLKLVTPVKTEEVEAKELAVSPAVP